MVSVPRTKQRCPVCKVVIYDEGVAINLRNHLNKVHNRRCTNKMVDKANELGRQAA